MKKQGTLPFIILLLVMVASIVGFAYFGYPILDSGKSDIISTLLAVITMSIFVVSLSIIISLVINNKQRKVENSLKQRLAMWNSISYKVKKAGEIAFNNLPIGIMIISSKRKVLWSNDEAKKIFQSALEEMDIKNICKELDVNIKKQNHEFNVKIYDEIYRVELCGDNNIVYLTKVTDYINLQDQYQDRTTALGFINIDNFEEGLSEFDVQERAEYSGKIIGMIARWFEKYGAYVRAFTDNRYLLIMDRSQLEKMMATSFPLLDDIKQILHNGRSLRITLSIGIRCCDKPNKDVSEEAIELLDLTLNRGGDQVAVKIDDEMKFFGGKQEALPKDNKIDVRIKSEELQDLFLSSSSIFVMSHVNTDTDGFGASFALYKMAKALGKEVYIVSDKVDATVTKVLENINKEYVDLKNRIITPKKAISLADDNSLLMIVDFQTIYQSPDNDSSLGAPNEKIIKKIKNIAIIDHHRRGSGAIENPKFYYSKTYASSSVEIVLELLEFWDKEVEFTPVEATWLLLGIIVDTNNFIYRTNAKTFEVSSILKRFGADMTEAQRYLKESITEIKNRNNFTENLTFYKDIVAISFSKDNKRYQREEIAKISDSMLSIENVELGITIAYLAEGVVGVSARSLGLVNAQAIMERLGGGGHLTGAAAQVKNSTIDQVYKNLLKILDEVISTEKKIKVIFQKDLRGRGKKYDIKEFGFEEAKKLIEDNYAIAASSENIKMLEDKKNAEQLQREKELNELKEQKEILESEAVKFPAKSSNGILKTPLVDKHIVDIIKKEFNLDIDIRKIELVEAIKSLGSFTIPISLDKEVTANLVLHVTEE